MISLAHVGMIKVSEADFDQPRGQWLVAAGSAANTIKLINVQKPGFVQDNNPSI